MAINCEHCGYEISAPATEGGLKVRTRMVLIKAGEVSVHCPHCRQATRIAPGADDLQKANPRRRRVALGVPRGRRESG